MRYTLLLAWSLLALEGGLATAQPSMGQIDLESARRSAERNARNPHYYTQGCPYTTTTVVIGPNQTGTGLDEEFIVMKPCGFNPAGPKLPLIVMFNGFCLGPNSIFNGITQIPDEANARGWLVVAIRCGGQALQKKSYGIYKCQPNVDLVLNHMMQNYPVDADRIYGIGWSAGGGAIASYGARHLDPSRPMFAAIATNAGTYDLVDSYNNVAADVKAWMSSALMLQGPPLGATLFGYLRSSTLLFNPIAGTIDLDASQVRNLTETPILHVYSTDDPITHLPPLNMTFAAYLSTVGAPITSVPFTGLFDAHSWDLLNPTTTLNFLQSHTLDREPPSFGAVCDRDATYYWAEVKQRTPGSFSRVECDTDSANNLVEVSSLSNVNSVSLTPPPAVFDATQNFQLRVQTNDVGVTRVFVKGVASSPTYVLNGSSLSSAWTYDAAGSRLIFDVQGTGVQLLTIRYDDYSAVLTGSVAPKIGTLVHLNMTASSANKPLLLFLGLAEGVIPISPFDPADDRNLLIGAAPTPILVQGATNGAGSAAISFQIPNSSALIGTKVYNQFLTLPGTGTIVDEISNRHDFVISP